MNYKKGGGLIGMLITLLIMGAFMVFMYHTFISENSQRKGVDGDPSTSVIDEAGTLRDGIEERHNRLLDEI